MLLPFAPRISSGGDLGLHTLLTQERVSLSSMQFLRVTCLRERCLYGAKCREDQSSRTHQAFEVNILSEVQLFLLLCLPLCVIGLLLNHLANLLVRKLHIGVLARYVGSCPVEQFLVVVTFQRSEEHTSELQSRQYLVCRLLLEKKKK